MVWRRELYCVCNTSGKCFLCRLIWSHFIFTWFCIDFCFLLWLFIQWVCFLLIGFDELLIVEWVMMENRSYSLRLKNRGERGNHTPHDKGQLNFLFILMVLMVFQWIELDFHRIKGCWRSYLFWGFEAVLALLCVMWWHCTRRYKHLCGIALQMYI